MTDFKTSFKAVKNLAADFKANERLYLSPKYSEAEVRKDYIDKFFTALGWDVNHNIQKNPYEQEVKVEKTQSNQKRTDYTFFLLPNFKDPKFFVEAKKPQRNLRNADDYFQTIRYGWNANTPIAVLTDFEEFHILDCRFKPNINSVLQNKNHKQFHYTDYADLEKFKEIYYLFSHEAIADNSLEKYADSLPKPKGKAVRKGLPRIGYQTIDEDFLEYIDDTRETLAKAFKKNDTSLTSEELTEATQRTIDRLVFIRFLEDKLIEPDNYVTEFGNGGNSWNDFIAASRKLNSKYNGIVFKKHFIDEKNFKGPDENEFAQVCEDISHLNSPYDFNAIPIHILGSIYERFLGKVVHATDKRVKVEEKPEVRKAGGVYYTPKYIVDYIVQNTVGKLINDKTPKEISEMHFADIACGSGSFLISVFECLLEYHNNYYQENRKQAKKDGCLEKDGAMVLSIKQKQKILQNNIYGVDIDQQATEVTQLSLALKMLEDETTATANDMQVLFHEKILPNLSKNIVCGNSLIGTDLYERRLFMVGDSQDLNTMSFQEKFSDIYNYGGFDAIVGNPPWGQKAVYFSDIEKEYLISHYPFSSVGILDLFRFFIEKALSIVKSKGRFGYVLPDIVLLKNYDQTRKYILENLKVKLIDYWGMVFKNVNLDVCSLIGIKDIKNSQNLINITVHSKEKDKEFYNCIRQNKFYELPGYKFNLYLNEKSDSIIKKISENPIQNYFEIHEGIHSGNIRNKLFVDSKINNNCKKLIFGRDEVKRYFLKWNGKWVDYRKEIINKQLSEYAGLGKKEYFESNKIIVRRTGDYVLAAIDVNKYYFSNNVFVCIPLENNKLALEFFLGLLNSNLITWFYLTIQPRRGKLFSELKINQLYLFPVPEINFKNKEFTKNYNNVVRIVKELNKICSDNIRNITDREKNKFENLYNGLNFELDKIVYNLFKLNSNEKEFIEKFLKNK